METLPLRPRDDTPGALENALDDVLGMGELPPMDVARETDQGLLEARLNALRSRRRALGVLVLKIDELERNIYRRLSEIRAAKVRESRRRR
jgi:hypothetical protein